MSVFMKTCFNCGKKTKNLYESMCEECFKEANPPIKEIKPINLKVCNMCGKIHYNNALFTLEQIEEMIHDIVKKRIILNDGYGLESLKVENFEQVGNKISFDVSTNCNFNK